MEKITIFLGNPSCEKEWDFIEDYSYATNSNIETSIIVGFKHLFKKLITPSNSDLNYFELLILAKFDKKIKLPKITLGLYKQRGFTFPKLSIHGYYALDEDTGRPIFIADNFIETIGEDCEQEFSYEYFGFERDGEIKVRLNEVIYLINEEEHIHHNFKFIPVFKKK